jgi:hypothetical protein
MSFLIAYRNPRHPKSIGASIVGSELKVREVIKRLRREGCEVTRITPPLTPLSRILTPALSNPDPIK